MTTDASAVEGVDVITTEVWRYRSPDVSDQVLDPEAYDSWMGDVNDLLPYRVSSELCERTGNRDVFCMHELPSVHNAEHEIGRKLLAQAPNDFERTVIEEGLEITDECFEKNASVIFREAEKPSAYHQGDHGRCAGIVKAHAEAVLRAVSLCGPKQGPARRTAVSTLSFEGKRYLWKARML